MKIYNVMGEGLNPTKFYVILLHNFNVQTCFDWREKGNVRKNCSAKWKLLRKLNEFVARVDIYCLNINF